MREPETEIKYQKAMKQYLSSKDSMAKIAKAFKISARRFALFMGEHGVKIEKIRSKKYNIDKQTWDNANLGKESDQAIAEKLNVPPRLVCLERHKRGIPTFEGLYLTQEGDPCRSIYEAKYDAYLHDKGIDHEHEVRLPGMVADFKVGEAFHEIVGMMPYKKYAERHEEKKEMYKKLNLQILWIFPKDIDRLFRCCLKTKLKFRERICLDCGTKTLDMVKNVCRNCYMKKWHDKGEQKTCGTCGKMFISPEKDNRKFCSHVCYSDTLKKIDYGSILQEVEKAEKSIMAIAIENNIKPSTLYMILRRKKNKENGLTSEGLDRKK